MVFVASFLIRNQICPKWCSGCYTDYLQPLFLNLQSNVSERILRVLSRFSAASFSKFAIKFVRNEIEGTTQGFCSQFF